MISLDKYFIRQAVAGVEDGGPRSGNWGHKGRPGLRGGSAKGSGGSAMRSSSVITTSGYIGAKTVETFRKAASTVHHHKNGADWYKGLEKEGRKAIRDQYADVMRQTGSDESFYHYRQRLYKMLMVGSTYSPIPVGGTTGGTGGGTSGGTGVVGPTPPPTPKPSKPTHVVVSGKDISGTYVPDPAAPSKIKDIIHQQGFDGIPKVVSSEDFDKIAAEHKDMPLLYRTYSAPDEGTIKTYDEGLEGGDWYVDCTVGASLEGQGMYTNAVFDHDSTYDMHACKLEMGKYQRYARQRMYAYMDAPAGTVKNKDPRTGEIAMIDKKGISFAKDPPPNGTIVYLKESSYETRDYYNSATGEHIEIDANYRGYFYVDGKLYHINDQDIEYDPAHETYSLAYYSPPKTMYYLEADHEKFGIPDCKSTIRRMTMDPSAKMISLEDARSLMRKYNAGAEERKTAAAISEIASGSSEFDAKKAFPGLGVEIDDYAGTAFEGRLRGLYGDDPEAFRKDVGQYVCARLFEELQDESPAKYGSFKNPFSKPEGSARVLFDNMVDSDVLKLPRRRWLDSAIGRFGEKFSKSIDDPGQIAALYGYDAINASGSAAGSYVIVLNRTKVVLDKNAVEKRSMHT